MLLYFRIEEGMGRRKFTSKCSASGDKEGNVNLTLGLSAIANIYFEKTKFLRIKGNSNGNTNWLFSSDLDFDIYII